MGSASANDAVRVQIEALRAAKDSLLKSEDSPLLPEQRAHFEQLAYYPIDLRYRLRGELHIYGRQRIVEIPNTDGTTTELERFGRFVAAFGEKDFWLEVYRSPQTGEAEVFFKDLTNGHTTYGGGRYVAPSRGKTMACMSLILIMPITHTARTIPPIFARYPRNKTISISPWKPAN